MPCSDGRDAHGPTRIEYREDPILLSRNTLLAQLLCEACQHLESLNFGEFSGQLQEWWIAHKKEDEIRLKKQTEQDELKKIKKLALSKLTSEEIKALGLTNKTK